MKYKVLLFDADETLFDFERSERESLKNTVLEYQIAYDEAYHLIEYQKINDAIWADLENGLITLEKLKVERFTRFLKVIDVKADAFEFAANYMKHLSNSSFLLDSAKELIESLYPNYQLAIITNGITSIQKKRVCQSEIAKYFDAILISEEVGYQKPQTEIYEAALRELGHNNKEDVLMIGDNLSSDIRGGVNYGIDTCWINCKNIENHTMIQPTFSISNIAELCEIL